MNKISTIVREWFFLRSLRKSKQKAVFEIKKDIDYLLTYKGDMISYDESKARKRMAELKTKGEQRTDIEHQELDHILDVIALSKATKNELEKSKILLKDCENYLSIL